MATIQPCASLSTFIDCGCSFSGVHIALFSAGGSISKKFGPVASKAGATVRCFDLLRCCGTMRPPHELVQQDVRRQQAAAQALPSKPLHFVHLQFAETTVGDHA